MKRGSLATVISKRQVWRKYPSAVLKTQITPVVHTFIPQYQTSVSLNIANMLCENIMKLTDKAIQQIQASNFVNVMETQVNELVATLESAILPLVESTHLSIISPQDEPQQTIADCICSAQKQVQKKVIIKRETACISAFNTPLRQLKQREKLSTSSKDLYQGSKKSFRNQLIPLPSVECEEDVRSTILQTFYRDKAAKQDQINQEDNPPKPQFTRIFRKTNRDKQQYAFDYDGEKIPIINSNSLKSNPVKVLKTVYKVHKEKSEMMKNAKKTHYESIRFGKFAETLPSHRFLQNGTDLHDLKKGIQQSVRWAGKLQSIKLITESDAKKQ